jgi:hypothetical protein
MAVTATKVKSSVESLRDIVQDLLVPDMKALKVGLEAHRVETKLQTDGVRSEVASLRNEMNISLESLRTEMRLRDEKQTQSIHALSDRTNQALAGLTDKIDQGFRTLSDKMGYTTDLRERIAVL